MFNLDEDPHEITNLANDYPDLVRELLREAEEAIKDAPKQWRGDMVHVEAPSSPQHGWFASIRTLGSQYEEIIPFGVYLSDSEDLTKLNYVRLTEQQSLELIVISVKIITTYIVLPTLLLAVFIKDYCNFTIHLNIFCHYT